jgi:hypothetical protein
MLKKVNILSVDKDKIIKVTEAGLEVYSFFVKISENPSPEWNVRFKEAWEKRNRSRMSDVLAISGRIPIRFNFGEDLQTCVNELLEVVDECNEFVEQCHIEQIKREEERNKKEIEELEKIRVLKKQLKTVVIQS